jgi:hypothetical protein
VYSRTHGSGAFKIAVGSKPKFEKDALRESEGRCLIRHKQLLIRRKQRARKRAQQVAAKAAPYLLRVKRSAA